MNPLAKSRRASGWDRTVYNRFFYCVFRLLFLSLLAKGRFAGLFSPLSNQGQDLVKGQTDNPHRDRQACGDLRRRNPLPLPLKHRLPAKGSAGSVKALANGNQSCKTAWLAAGPPAVPRQTTGEIADPSRVKVNARQTPTSSRPRYQIPRNRGSKVRIDGSRAASSSPRRPDR